MRWQQSKLLLMGLVLSSWSSASLALECRTGENCQPCTLKLVPAESRATALAAQQALKDERYDDARRLYTDLKDSVTFNLAPQEFSPLAVARPLYQAFQKVINRGNAVVSLSRGFSIFTLCLHFI